MSASMRSDRAIDDPLRYAPRWARQSPPLTPEVTAIADEPSSEDMPAPPMAPGVRGPNIDRPLPPLRPFEGDIAIKDLRRRLALDPDALPPPPMPEKRGPALPWMGRFALVLLVAVVVGFAIALLLVPQQPGERSTAGAPTLPGLALPVAVMSARLVIESQRAFANEPLALGISLADATGEETVTLIGLVNGTKLTAGSALSPTDWQLSARELGSAFAYAPKDFVGAMDAAIDLRSARDRVVDSQVARLEWVPKEESRLPRVIEPPAHTPDPGDLALLMKRAQDALQNGDIASARLILRRAASAGNGQAALTLGATYDPAFLAKRGVLGLASDPAQARTWYERAAQLGVEEAVSRLERISQSAARDGR
jgi:hypothetical protein